jgi:hypothetical protein
MPPIKITIALLLASFAVAEATSAPPALQNDESLRQMAVGIWSTKFSTGPATITDYMQVSADGTYSYIAKASLFGIPKWVHAEGTWSIEKGAWNTVTLLSTNPKAKPTSSSEIVEMDSKKWGFIVTIHKDKEQKNERQEKIKVAAIPEEFIKHIAELKKDLKKPNQ